ncbi:MAG: hypothetical protein K2L98_01935 [Bacilli bacterium]|nr:hypothetical protein [Bacilli bacterium]
MTKEKFIELWKGTTEKWLDGIIEGEEEGKQFKCSSLCSIKTNACQRIYENYSRLKELVKDLYFRDKDKTISRYKRAAVIVYAVIAGEDPLEYKNKTIVDRYFLKQNFAFFLALTSITQDYIVESMPIFCFSELGVSSKKGEDSFLTSVYKDIFYSEIYKNYNVLTMANIFGLLLERVSTLKKLRTEE